MMKNEVDNTIFNKNIYIEYPSDFYEMSDDEIKTFFADNLLRFGVRNANTHTILSVGKTKSSFINLFTNAKSVVCSAEKKLRNNLKDYVLNGEFDTKVFGKSAKGIRFEYTAVDNDVRQFCEMVVVKLNNCFYVVYCLSRLSDADDSRPLFASFRDGLRFIK